MKRGLEFVIGAANMILACIVGIAVGVFTLLFSALANIFDKWADGYDFLLDCIDDYVIRLKKKLFPVDREEEP